MNDHPYGWRVVTSEPCLFVCDDSEDAAVQPDDIVTAVGGIAYLHGMHFPLYTSKFTAGETVTLEVIREDEIINVAYTIPEQSPRFIMSAIAFLAAMPFLAAATFLALIRPLTKQRVYSVVFFCLIGVWLVSGLTTKPLPPLSWLLWVAVPISAYIHWNTPVKLMPLPGWMKYVLYGASGIMVALDIFRVLPAKVFMLSIVLIVLPAYSILLAQIARKDRIRHRQPRLMFFGMTASFAPSLLWITSDAFVAPVTSSIFVTAAVTSMILLPLYYTYAMCYIDVSSFAERRLRYAVMTTTYILLSFVVSGMVVSVVAQFTEWTSSVTSAYALMLTAIALLIYPIVIGYRRFFDAFLYCRLPRDMIAPMEHFSSRLPDTLDTTGLANAVQQMTQETGIAESALYIRRDNTFLLQYVDVLVVPEFLSAEDASDEIAAYAPGIRIFPLTTTDEQVVGIWMIGKKVSDDFYAVGEIAQLHGFAAQIAAVMEVNNLHRQMQENIERTVRQGKLAMVGRFAAELAHQINTPLGSALLNMENELTALEKEKGNDDHQLRVRVALTSLYDAINALKAVRAFSRPVDPSESIDNLHMFFNEMLALAKPKLEDANVTTDIRIDSGLPPMVGDWSRLSIAFGNIIANACEAMGNKNNTLTISASEEGGWVVIRVTDTGVGMPHDVLAHVFDDAFSTKGKRGNMGIGLTISLSIIESLGGDITLMSKEGEGTTVTIRLPVNQGGNT